MNLRACSVALLAEGVDRNHFRAETSVCRNVALLAEGVDRNYVYVCAFIQTIRSPSSRRAWIEIPKRKKRAISLGSPSSRRAWIEIAQATCWSYEQARRPPRGGRG